MKKILLILLIIFFASLASGATYYVDDSGCSDSNAGTDPGSPWCSCPGHAEWGGSASLSAGDIVYFASDGKWVWNNGDGSVYLKVQAGVQYIGDVWPTADTAVGFGSSCTDGGCAEFEFSTDHVSHGSSQQWRMFHLGYTSGGDHATYQTGIKGFEVDCNEEAATIVGINYQGQAGITMTGATKYIKNLYIHDHHNTGDHYQYVIYLGTGPNSNSGWPNSGEPDGFDTEDVEILNNTITKTGRDAISLYPANDADHADNWIKDILIRGNDITYINCDASNCNSNPDNNYAAGSCFMLKNRTEDVIVEYNYCQHTRGSCMVTNQDGGHTHAAYNHDWRYNVCTDNSGSGSFGAKIKGSGNKRIRVYGNIFMSATRKTIGFTESLTSDVEVWLYNNIIYDNSIGISICERDIGGGQCSAGRNIITLEVKNNIIYNTGSGLAFDDQNGDATAVSNNLYYSSGTNKAYSNGTNYTAATITSLDSGGLTAAPGFKNTSNLPTGFSGSYADDMEPDNDGLSIALDTSPPVDAGADLGSSPYYGAINFSGKSGSLNRDNDGGGAWDIGAYEYYDISTLTQQISGAIGNQRCDVSAWPETTITIGMTTNIDATCKYDSTDLSYSLMANTFSTTGGTSHEENLLSDCGENYTYYVRCDDTVDSDAINFWIDKDPPPRRNITVK